MEPSAQVVARERRIGVHGGVRPGPLIVAVCGIHGNEPAGVRAAQAVLEELRESNPPFRGEFVALAGNLEALARNRRFVDKDLNRLWTAARVASLAAPPAAGPEREAGGAEEEAASAGPDPKASSTKTAECGTSAGGVAVRPEVGAGFPVAPRPAVGAGARVAARPEAGAGALTGAQPAPTSAWNRPGAEDREQRALLQDLRSAFARSEAPAILLDLHTSSADGPPFATMGDTLRNREFVTQLPIPVILGLEEQIDGALLEYVNNLGHVTAGIEAGRHDLQSSFERHVALLWLALIAAGALREEDVPRARAFRELLGRATAGIPRIVEMRYRHAIRAQDAFVMKPGFRNFDPVRKGDTLGTDCRGPVRASEGGVVLLPLYQGQGDDGFFLGRRVKPRWLTLSAALRRLGVPSLPHFLPGVHRHPEDAGTLIIDTWIARHFPLEIFHLLGYRKKRWLGRTLIVTRRRENPG